MPEKYYTKSKNHVIFHKDEAGESTIFDEIFDSFETCLEINGPWFFEPVGFDMGEIFSNGFATPEEALEAAEKYEEQQNRQNKSAK